MAIAASSALAVKLAMDIPWVALNNRFGLYKGLVHGNVTKPALVGALWLSILIVNACLVGHLALTASKWWTALLACAFAGFCVYGTFNGTAVVLFESWRGFTAVGDTLWGVVLFAVAGIAAFFVLQEAEAAEGSKGQEKSN